MKQSYLIIISTILLSITSSCLIIKKLNMDIRDEKEMNEIDIISYIEPKSANIDDIIDLNFYFNNSYLEALKQSRYEDAISIYRIDVCERGKNLEYFPPIINFNPVNEDDISEVLQTGEIIFRKKTINILPPINWPIDEIEGRGFSKDIHGWYPIIPFIHFLHTDGVRPSILGDQTVQLVTEYVTDWIKNNYFSDNDYRTSPTISFSWYDLAAGQRANTLSSLLSISSCSENINNEEFMTLLRGALDHIYYLKNPDYYVDYNNHGLFQSKGLLTICSNFPEIIECNYGKELAQERISEYFHSSFSKDYVHLEHSPQYFGDMLFLLSTILLEKNLEKEYHEELETLYFLAQESFAWFIAPGNQLVRLGDTESGKGFIEQLQERFKDYSDPKHPLLLDVLFDLNGDDQFPSQTKIFPDSGYGIIRHMQNGLIESKGESYLVLSAAFHSRVHKHADDLNVVWYEFETPILVDAGRANYEGHLDASSELWGLGFWYSDPERIYVESTHAHNTVEIDSISDNRKEISPYGSGIETVTYLDCGLYSISGYVLRSGKVNHNRVLILNPQKWLIVIDYLNDSVNETSAHKYTQWFHLSENAELVNMGLPLFIVDDVLIKFSNITDNSEEEVFFGKTYPRNQGWISSEINGFSPNWAVGFTQTTSNALFITLIEIGDSSEFSNSSTTISEKEINISIMSPSENWEIILQREGGKQISKCSISE